jgi:hypothetical protein
VIDQDLDCDVGTHIFWVDNFDLTDIWIVLIHNWGFTFENFLFHAFEDFRILHKSINVFLLNYFMGYPKISITQHGVMSIHRLIGDVCAERPCCLFVLIGFI